VFFKWFSSAVGFPGVDINQLKEKIMRQEVKKKIDAIIEQDITNLLNDIGVIAKTHLKEKQKDEVITDVKSIAFILDVIQRML
jgi:hypothetical protein